MSARKLAFRCLLALVALAALVACAGKQQVEDHMEEALLAEQRRLEADLEAQRRLTEERQVQDSLAREEEREAERAAADTERARHVLEERVHFQFDCYRLDEEAQETLRRKAPILRLNPELRLRIEGHCDERGPVEYNLALGERRADAVKGFLQALQVGKEQLQVVSYGKERPLDTGSNEAAWARNRRAEFRITAGGERIRIR